VLASWKGGEVVVKEVANGIRRSALDIVLIAVTLITCSLAVGAVWIALRSLAATVRVGSTLVAAGIVILFCLWRVPQWQVPGVIDPDKRFEVENEARRTLAQIIGGFLLLAGFYASWQNFVLSQESQITDRFTKAIEQLGSVDGNGKKKLEVRLGGIYALARIAKDSERDHWPVIEVLTTYVRETAPRTQTTCNVLSPRELAEHHFSADIQAVLTVLGHRDTKDESPLQVPHIDKADLSGGAELKDARFDGAYLSLSDLSGADLRAAKLRGAYFTNACLAGADLRGADLKGAHFEKADLRGANLRLDRNNNKPTNLTDATDLDQSQIDLADGDNTTVLPNYLTVPERWKRK
jgi:hypothetical protein